MGLMDSIKKATKGKGKQIEQGIDQAAKAVEKVVPDEHDDKVRKAAAEVKKASRKIT